MKESALPPDLKILSCYLCWALGSEVEAESCSALFGGVHRNWRVTAQVEGVSRNFVLRQAPPPETFGFARQEVIPYNLNTEFTVLTELQSTSLSTPQVWGLDLEGAFWETPTFVAEFIEGQTVLEAIKADSQVVLRKFAEAILAMNCIAPDQVPSVTKQHNCSVERVSWLVQQSADMETPTEFQRGVDILSQSPDNLPQTAFGNGDLNPQNFIIREDGSIAIIDWEYAGFNDPLAEITLLHTWPPEAPFLQTHPVDKLYCKLAGINADLLQWYELHAALSGWLYAAKEQRHDVMKLREQWIKRLLTRF